MMRWDRGTWLEDEAMAYPNGGQTRKGSAVYPDGKTRRIFAGIPDTWFSIPAHGRIRGRYVAGYVTVRSEDGSDVDTGQQRWLEFRPMRTRVSYPNTTAMDNAIRSGGDA